MSERSWKKEEILLHLNNENSQLKRKNLPAF